MAGDDTKGHPAGTKTGDVIHVFQSGSIQMITDVAIDPAGNVWAANNWNNLEAVVAERSVPPHLDLGRRVGLHRHLRRRGAGEDPAAWARCASRKVQQTGPHPVGTGTPTGSTSTPKPIRTRPIGPIEQP